MSNPNPSTLEILKAARAKIADRRHWMQGGNAVDKNGLPVSPYDPSACRFCASGAIRNVCKDLKELEYVQALESVAPDARTLIETNDTAGHAAVLAMFDEAIARLEK